MGWLYYRFVHRVDLESGARRAEIQLPRWMKRRAKAPAAADEAEETESTTAPAAAVTAAIHNTQPSVVTQIAEAAAAEAKATGPAETPQPPTEAGVAAAAAASADTLPAPPDPSGTTQEEDGSPEFVIEDVASQAAPDAADEPLQRLDVDEIDLGFEEKARNTG